MSFKLVVVMERDHSFKDFQVMKRHLFQAAALARREEVGVAEATHTAQEGAVTLMVDMEVADILMEEAKAQEDSQAQEDRVEEEDLAAQAEEVDSEEAAEDLEEAAAEEVDLEEAAAVEDLEEAAVEEVETSLRDIAKSSISQEDHPEAA